MAGAQPRNVQDVYMVVDNAGQRQGGHNGHPLAGSDERQRGEGVVVLMDSLNPCSRRVAEASEHCSIGC